MWTCRKCGEQIEAQFDSCWKCAAKPEPGLQPRTKPGPWRTAFTLGIGFELSQLIVLFGPSSAFGPLQEFQRFAQFSHSLFLPMWRHGPESLLGAIFLLALPGLAMSLVWAGLLFGGWTLVGFAAKRLGLSLSGRRRLWWGIGALAAGVLAFIGAHAFEDRPVKFTHSANARVLVAGNTAFALDAYRELGAKPGNVFFSPYGISAGLALTYAGARGQTEQELARAARFGLGQADLHPAFRELTTRMRSIQHGTRLTLLTATGMWRNQDVPWAKAFLDTARADYDADLEIVDFKHAAPAACSRINSWAERRTYGRIPVIVQPGMLGEDTRLLLCNAVYFKGRWGSAFQRKRTASAPFQVDETRSVSVPMMYQSAEFKTVRVEEPAILLLELSYYGGDLKMDVILPETVNGLKELEDALTPEKLNTWLANLDQASPHETSVYLPRFTTRQAIQLVPILRALGVVSAFGDTADFSGMDGTRQGYLREILQQTFVEVNEEGTESAAVTLFEAATMGKATLLKADHPFLYLIRDSGSGTILFLGRLVDPGA